MNDKEIVQTYDLYSNIMLNRNLFQKLKLQIGRDEFNRFNLYSNILLDSFTCGLKLMTLIRWDSPNKIFIWIEDGACDTNMTCTNMTWCMTQIWWLAHFHLSYHNISYFCHSSTMNIYIIELCTTSTSFFIFETFLNTLWQMKIKKTSHQLSKL